MEEVTQPIKSPTLKDGTPTRAKLRDLTMFNPEESINQSIILTDMAKIDIGAPSTIWKLNLMECT